MRLLMFTTALSLLMQACSGIQLDIKPKDHYIVKGVATY